VPQPGPTVELADQARHGLTAAATSAAVLTVLAASGRARWAWTGSSAVGTRPLVFGAALLGLLVAGAAVSVLSAQLLLRARPHR
jgi:hypothetical protein